MTGQPLPGGPEVIELSSVPGFVVFDLPGVPESAGGTRLAPDVSVAEVALLARAMTYKFAALDMRMGGAKAGVRGDPADRAGKAALMARFCAEIAPLTDTRRLLTGPDMGTVEEDFAPLRERRASPTAISAVVDGVPFEDLLTGYGVARRSRSGAKSSSVVPMSGPVSSRRASVSGATSAQNRAIRVALPARSAGSPRTPALAPPIRAPSAANL